MANIKTIALSGAETAVYISGQNCDIRNDGTDTIYASAMPGVTTGADGVLSIPAGGAAKLLDTGGAVYLLGSGSVQLCGNDYAEQVFKSAASASGGGGTEDTVARTAINTHAGNSEIHLTAAELEAAVEDANSYSDSKAADALTAAKEYADSLSMSGGGGVSQEYTDAQDAATLTAAKEYADSIAGSSGGVSQEYTDAQDTATLTAAKDYAAEQDANTLEAAKTYAAEQDTATLNSAKSYADSKDTTTLTAAKTYSDNAIAAKFITGSEAASLDNCPEDCWYGQYE